MGKIRVAIAVADDALDRADAIMRACQALGFEADAVLTGVGIFTGSTDADNVSSLRAVVGVAAVEGERVTRIHASRRR